jgi:hypothetical protein
MGAGSRELPDVSDADNARHIVVISCRGPSRGGWGPWQARQLCLSHAVTRFASESIRVDHGAHPSPPPRGFSATLHRFFRLTRSRFEPSAAAQNGPWIKSGHSRPPSQAAAAQLRRNGAWKARLAPAGPRRARLGAPRAYAQHGQVNGKNFKSRPARVRVLDPGPGCPYCTYLSSTWWRQLNPARA